MRTAHVHDVDGNCVVMSEAELRSGLENLDGVEISMDGIDHKILDHLRVNVTDNGLVGRGYKMRIKVWDSIAGGYVRLYARDFVPFRDMLNNIIDEMEECYPEKM